MFYKNQYIKNLVFGTSLLWKVANMQEYNASKNCALRFISKAIKKIEVIQNPKTYCQEAHIFCCC